MSAMASQITGVSIVYSTVVQAQINENIKLHVTGFCEGNSPQCDQWIPHTKGHAITEKMFPFDNVIMIHNKTVRLFMSSTDILCDNLTHSILQFYYRPAALDDAIFVHLSKNEKVIRKFSDQSREDWKNFLENRAKELVPGNVESQYIAVQKNMALHIETTIVESAQRPISRTIFHHNSNSMKNLFWCNSIVGYHVAAKFCTCIDSTAVVHVLNFIAITSAKLGREQNEISIKLELRWKSRSWNEPQALNWKVTPKHLAVYIVITTMTSYWTRWRLKSPASPLFDQLFRRRSKKTSKLRVTGLYGGNSAVIGEFPAQMASNAENASIWWRHHVTFEGYECVITGRIVISWKKNERTNCWQNFVFCHRWPSICLRGRRWAGWDALQASIWTS